MIAPAPKTDSLDYIKTGDVLAFRSNSFWSRLIRLRTFSRVSHVGFAVRVCGRLCVIEAVEWYAIRVWPLSRYLEDPKYVVEHYELLDKKFRINRELVVDAAWGLWGSRYASPLQFFRSWGLLTHWLATKLGIPVDTDKDRYHCSETILSCLIAGGYVGEGFDKDPAETSPGDIVHLPCLQKTGVVRCSV